MAALGLAGVGVASAEAASQAAAPPTLCTWGGTPAEPTGTFSISPGLTNTASVAPAAFEVEGALAGGPGCAGEFAYHGQIDAGGTCSANTFQGTAAGIPGVAGFSGSGAGVFAVGRLYGTDANLVGVAVSQLATSANAQHLGDCGTPGGLTGGTFSSVLTLSRQSGSPSQVKRKRKCHHRHPPKHKRCRPPAARKG